MVLQYIHNIYAIFALPILLDANHKTVHGLTHELDGAQAA